jgi:hypothetical protein
LEELSLWSTCVGVEESLVVAPCGPWRCRGAEETLGVARLLCSGMLSVRLCRLRPVPSRCTFWRLLGGERGRLGGLTHGSGTLEPLKLAEEFVFLCHVPCVTLSEEWLTEPHLQAALGSPPSLGGFGHTFS